jgi:hypothetical protein
MFPLPRETEALGIDKVSGTTSPLTDTLRVVVIVGVGSDPVKVITSAAELVF